MAGRFRKSSSDPSAPGSGEASPPAGAHPRTGQGTAKPAKRRRRSPNRRFIDRVERMDWRYKVQVAVGFCLAVTVLAFALRERISTLGDWGYLGAFIINGISNATVILPAPGGAVIAIMAQDFNPFLVGLAAGLGGTIGGSTAYFAGFVASGIPRRRQRHRRLQGFMKRLGGPVIFVGGLAPLLPGDVVGIVAGSVRYPFRRYLAYNGLGSTIKMIGIAYMGADLLTRLEDLLEP